MKTRTQLRAEILQAMDDLGFDSLQRAEKRHEIDAMSDWNLRRTLRMYKKVVARSK